MIAVGFIVWTVIALVVGIVIGKAIAAADRRAAAQREAEQCPAYVPGSWAA